jgi:hypothetical protein
MYTYTYKVFATYDMVDGTESYRKLGSVCISSKILCFLQTQHGENLSEFMKKILVIIVNSVRIVHMYAMLQGKPTIA